jgi:hypothetical protein
MRKWFPLEGCEAARLSGCAMCWLVVGVLALQAAADVSVATFWCIPSNHPTYNNLLSNLSKSRDVGYITVS